MSIDVFEVAEQAEVGLVNARKTLKVFVVGSSTHYAEWLADKILLMKNMADAELVMFTGGEDVNPELYGERRGKYTYFTNRDVAEVEAYKLALELKKPMIGICRGAQLLTVMNGGKLIQDVSDHANGQGHPITWEDGKNTGMTSLHHQMCNIFVLPPNKYKLHAYAAGVRSDRYLNGDDEEVYFPYPEPEVFSFPDTKSLGIQGHPEMFGSFNNETHVRLRSLLEEILK